MEISTMSIIIIYSLLILALVIVIYFSHRNHKVFEFLIYLNDLSYKWSMNNLDKESAYEWFMNDDNLASYNEMVYKFWIPLKIESWATEEQIEKFGDMI